MYDLLMGNMKLSLIDSDKLYRGASLAVYCLFIRKLEILPGKMLFIH